MTVEKNIATLLLEEVRVFFLGTINEGKPAVRPFGIVNEFEGKTYLAMTSDKKVYQQLMKNPVFEICGNLPEKWFRISGELKRDTNFAAKKDFWNRSSKFQDSFDSLDNPDLELFYIASAVIEIHESNPQNVRTITLGE